MILMCFCLVLFLISWLNKFNSLIMLILLDVGLRKLTSCLSKRCSTCSTSKHTEVERPSAPLEPPWNKHQVLESLSKTVLHYVYKSGNNEDIGKPPRYYIPFSFWAAKVFGTPRTPRDALQRNDQLCRSSIPRLVMGKSK